MSLCPVSLCRLKSQVILPNPQTYPSSGVQGHVLTGPFFTHQHPPSPNYALRQLCFLPQCGDSISPLSPFFPPSTTSQEKRKLGGLSSLQNGRSVQRLLSRFKCSVSSRSMITLFLECFARQCCFLKHWFSSRSNTTEHGVWSVQGLAGSATGAVVQPK